MPKRRPLWPVRYSLETPQYAFFISHVNEDSAAVTQLKDAITRSSERIAGRRLECYLDACDWSDGRPGMEVIRERLIQSLQMIAWITPASLQSSRGWVWIELAYGHLLELSLNEKVPRETTLQYVVPIFRGVTLAEIERTPWIDYWSKRFTQIGDDPTPDELADHLVKFSLDETLRRTQFLY